VGGGAWAADDACVEDGGHAVVTDCGAAWRGGWLSGVVLGVGVGSG